MRFYIELAGRLAHGHKVILYDGETGKTRDDLDANAGGRAWEWTGGVDGVQRWKYLREGEDV